MTTTLQAFEKLKSPLHEQMGAFYSNSISRRYLRWLVIGFSTYCLYPFVADLLAALISSLNWNRN